ncbi:hypothetical protein [Streptomyces sp. WM6378]|uniref:hypothetical protein n=1 Tax=Streptomyces sp. WM6378 TaxID=1415557 RepID=UPI000B10BE84|nr:hypothetical protein [Streptomyces sp. WM6378]
MAAAELAADLGAAPLSREIALTGRPPSTQDALTARRSVEALLERLGWSCGPGLDPHNRAHRRFIDSVGALVRLGYPRGTEQLLPYGRLAAQLAITDLDMVEEQPTPTGQIEVAVALTVLYGPMLLSLRRMAHAQESARRF